MAVREYINGSEGEDSAGGYAYDDRGQLCSVVREFSADGALTFGLSRRPCIVVVNEEA